MASFWLSFRLDADTVGGRSYSDRWAALNDAVLSVSGVNYWAQTSSFYVFSSASSIGQLGSKFKAAIAPTHDLFVMRELDSKNAVICGKNEDADIFGLMPYLSKI